MLKIGFATEFYTLWDVTTEPKYFTDSYGNHWLQGENTYFGYIQNISKDLSTVKTKYPDLEIDEDLRGKNRSWSRSTEEDLTPQILKFGKYYGKSIQEVPKPTSVISFGCVKMAEPKLKEYVMNCRRLLNICRS